jgi:hypothetical protein
LAFHPYPQVIRAVFNPHRFGPPLSVTSASPCSWVDRPGFGLYPQQLIALVTGLAFAVAPLDTSLASLLRSNSPDHNAKGTQSVATWSKPQAQPPTACKQVVSGSLSLPALGCFSPVPHGTRSLSVTRESLALEGGPPSFTPDYSGRALLRNSTTQGASLSPTGLSPSMAPRSRGLRLASPYACVGPTTPRPQGPRFGLYPFRSPLLRASRLISLSTRYLDVSVPRVSSLRLRAE